MIYIVAKNRKTLKLEKELFNLIEMLRDDTSDFQNQINKEYGYTTNLKLDFLGPQKDILVEADKVG